MVSDSSSKPYVIYVPGFRSADDPQDKAIQILQTIYPNAETVKNFPWENSTSNSMSLAVTSALRLLPSGLSQLGELAFNATLKKLGNVALEVGSIIERWKKALRDVVPTAQLLANHIKTFSPEKQKRVILVGHSLGGNIVIRALVHLYRQNITIQHAVLLGAAMDNDDPQILTAIESTSKPVCSMVNPDDLALYIYQLAEGSKALGTGCVLDCNPFRFIESFTPSSIGQTGGHASESYLAQWSITRAKFNDFSQIKVRQPGGDFWNVPVKTMDIEGLWTLVDHFMGWKLEKAPLLSYFRILDPNHKHRAWSTNEREIKMSFEDIKQQIRQYLKNNN